MMEMKIKASLYKSQVTQVTWLFLLLCVQGLFISKVDAQIYKWTDDNGQVHYGDKKPSSVDNKIYKQHQIEEVKIKV